MALINYQNWEEAAEAVRKLGIKSKTEYNIRYDENPRLPCDPTKYYPKCWKINGSWAGFLGIDPIPSYKTFEEASQATITLGITNWEEYGKRSHEDNLLPRNPYNVFRDVWNEKGGAKAFFGKLLLPEHYESWKIASREIRKLGVTSPEEYEQICVANNKFPLRPDLAYWKCWARLNGWDGFLGLESIYGTYEEVSTLVKELNIKSSTEYQKLAQIDKRFPSRPDNLYAGTWETNGKWAGFLGKEIIEFYETWEEASKAASQFNFPHMSAYRKGRHQDERLPAKPEIEYKDVWELNGGWSVFLKLIQIYETWEEASAATRKLGIKTYDQYLIDRLKDKKLPPQPSIRYKKVWEAHGGFKGFACGIVKELTSLEDLQLAIKYLGVKTPREYGAKYKHYPFCKLPRHPDRHILTRVFWPGWTEALGTDFYSYEQLREIVRKHNIKGIISYKALRSRLDDPKMPGAPEETYENWINWYVFCGKDEPYQVKFIQPTYKDWASKIEEFMEIARGAGNKKNALCRFERNFIEKHQLGYSPKEFLETYGTLEFEPEIQNHLLKQYKVFIESIESKRREESSHNINRAVIEFLDYVIEKDLSKEDETGVFIPLARNPFSRVKLGQLITRTLSETNKSILAYHYITDAREWIVPNNAKFFKDLSHLYDEFTGDWYRVSSELVDRTDPNCVWEERLDSKRKPVTYLWSPVNWIMTFALLHTPFRGRQIAYNDSGEADSIIPAISKTGGFDWVKNSSPIAGMTKRQGFIRQFSNNDIGAFCTTNKTSNDGQGYEIPWLDYDLAYWLVQLREWQSKYNPIHCPTPWVELTSSRVNLNKSQLKNKGANCFLFRGYGEKEPGSFSNALNHRLAAALCNVQDSQLTLAKLESEKADKIYNYRSEYTAHSVRASLITAFLDDFGIPPHVVMKIVGHSSIVMTGYYYKPGSEKLRYYMSVGEKRALLKRKTSQIQMVRQGQVDRIKNELVSNSKDALLYASSSTPPANFMFTDYGICPFAGSYCDQGGEEIRQSKIASPVPAGYLGKQNCIRCRFFISGPAFLGGLISLQNEIFLEAKKLSYQLEELRNLVAQAKDALTELDREEYQCEKEGTSFLNLEQRHETEALKDSRNAELQRCTKKLDTFLCDLNALNRLNTQCLALINENENTDNGETGIKLIKKEGYEFRVEPQETTYFHQLSEICLNAELYEAANASSAIIPRSQLLDRMAFLNGMDPTLMWLDEKQQLAIGNQMSELLLARLKTWDRVDEVISGKVYLAELTDDQALIKTDIEKLFNATKGLFNGNRNSSRRAQIKS